jgi:hypothetical protein
MGKIIGLNSYGSSNYLTSWPGDGNCFRKSQHINKDKSMKNVLAMLAGAALILALNTTRASAADKEVTIKGEAKCAMCMLHEGDACKTVIQTEHHGKTQTYYLVDNDISKSFKEDVCHGAKKVVATGTVSEIDGKQKLTLTKIELAKQ